MLIVDNRDDYCAWFALVRSRGVLSRLLFEVEDLVHRGSDPAVPLPLLNILPLPE